MTHLRAQSVKIIRKQQNRKYSASQCRQSNMQATCTNNLVKFHRMIFSARCNIHVYISRLCHDASPSVRLSVTELTEVHWRIIANLGFKFRFHFTAHRGKQHGACSPCCLRADHLAPCQPVLDSLVEICERIDKQTYSSVITILRTFQRRSINNSILPVNTKTTVKEQKIRFRLGI